ncbi:response regulator [Paenibacillus spiritus]|uniref:Response regulator n=1 Tax=Paenibacillus spiritus TaxID=2496557 RepID=A0A5J5GBK0_9BACL|nr:MULTISPECIES: response regulator [Paenibacillus]KAA9005381.1 response regulator [Paenibacillus spiritus]
MLSILIVDDEVLIREGLSRMISKQSEFFHVAGSCQNGREALELLSGGGIDLVITDIRMPEVDGLELIRKVKEHYPNTRCILMSGFTEFSYARDAIRYSAVDYLLKPIDKEQLFGLLHRLDTENRERADQENRLRLRLLDSYLHAGSASHSSAPMLSLPQPFYAVCVHRAGNSETMLEGSEHFRMVNGLDTDCLTLQPLLQMWIGYFPEEPTPEAIRQFFKPLLSAGGGAPVHVGASASRSQLSELKAAYVEASRACYAGIYSDASLFFAYSEDLAPTPESVSEPTAADWKELGESLQILSTDRVTEWLRQQFAALRLRRAEPQEIVRFCRNVEEEAAKEFQDLFPLSREERETLEKSLLSCMTFAKMEELFLSSLLPALDQIRGVRKELGGKAVEHVKRWIAANYNQHADLNSLAGMVFLTPSYLSKLFKQETGLTLTEYITEIRIKKAKLLLRQEPNMKVHSIGAEVGYPDPAYFNKLFKRVVGVTPNEYKKILP